MRSPFRNNITIKKTLFLTLFAISSMHAVLLRNGTRIPLDITQRTWWTLKKLETDNHIDLLTDLWISACWNDDNLKIFNREDTSIPELAKKFQCISSLEYEEKVATFHALGLCDQDGYMPQEVAHIIKSSIYIHTASIAKRALFLFLAPEMRRKPKMQSPLHPIHYANPKYWFKNPFATRTYNGHLYRPIKS